MEDNLRKKVVVELRNSSGEVLARTEYEIEAYLPDWMLKDRRPFVLDNMARGCIMSFINKHSMPPLKDYLSTNPFELYEMLRNRGCSLNLWEEK